MTNGTWQPDPARPVSREPALPVRSGWTPDPPTVRAMVMLGTGVAVLGVPLGLLWTVVAPDVPVRVVAGGAVLADAQPEQPAAADVWFALLAAPFGVLAALLAWWWRRAIRGVTGLLVMVAGALVAGVVAWQLGRQLGLSGFEEALAAAGPGDVVDRPPDLRAVDSGWWPPRLLGAPVVPALAAAVIYTLLAAWSRFASLRPEDDRDALVAPPDR